MGQLLRKRIKAIMANANNLTVVLPLKVVEMPQKINNEDENTPHIHNSTHGLGYSSRSKAQGDGLTPIFFGYRISSPGDERW